jgi:hypothetical protein
VFDPAKGIDGRNYRTWRQGVAPGGGTLGQEGKLRALGKAGGEGRGGAGGGRISGQIGGGCKYMDGLWVQDVERNG